jgi:hypothetical protein
MRLSPPTNAVSCFLTKFSPTALGRRILPTGWFLAVALAIKEIPVRARLTYGMLNETGGWAKFGILSPSQTRSLNRPCRMQPLILWSPVLGRRVVRIGVLLEYPPAKDHESTRLPRIPILGTHLGCFSQVLEYPDTGSGDVSVILNIPLAR